MKISLVFTLLKYEPEVAHTTLLTLDNCKVILTYFFITHIRQNFLSCEEVHHLHCIKKVTNFIVYSHTVQLFHHKLFSFSYFWFYGIWIFFASFLIGYKCVYGWFYIFSSNTNICTIISICSMLCLYHSEFDTWDLFLFIKKYFIILEIFLFKPVAYIKSCWLIFNMMTIFMLMFNSISIKFVLLFKV